MGKVHFGLKNVHYAIYDNATGTYGSWKRIPGAVSLSSDADTTQNDFYADDTVYTTLSAAGKETGTVEFACITPEMYVDLFNYVEGSNGLTSQLTEPSTVTVALGYEVSGNEGKMRGVRYNVTFTAPSQAANTLTDSPNPDTVSVNYTAVGRDFTIGGEVKNVLKSHCLEGSVAYDGFWSAVATPDGVAAADATLSALTLQNVTLDPTFASTAFSYAGTTSSASGTISATASDDDNATVAIMVNGAEYDTSASYNEGANIVTVLVTNDTAMSVYKVIVTRS